MLKITSAARSQTEQHAVASIKISFLSISYATTPELFINTYFIVLWHSEIRNEHGCHRVRCTNGFHNISCAYVCNQPSSFFVTESKRSVKMSNQKMFETIWERNVGIEVGKKQEDSMQCLDWILISWNYWMCSCFFFCTKIANQGVKLHSSTFHIIGLDFAD